ncbi:TRAP transporter small permease [Noviherbaspirillum sedimenti]|uniref:TRAP transporter small permease protein n=1 Tax=Noviherbaspirillum sedimenti TaxID=2320865 RepID=A0A3A3G496_9BURK|nr:TRAP transporter small permease [Noviherbaspirillum sedimenti]RJG03298.1 TRAP transporter small permease [Noviherbaspirillum sedimenti]
MTTQITATAHTTAEARGTFLGALHFLEDAAAVIGGLMLVAAMLLTSADATLRYFFNAPLTFNSYLTENYLVVGMITMSLAYGFRTGGYIRIVFLATYLPVRGAHLLFRAGLVVSAAYIAALAWFAGQHFWAAFLHDEVTMGVIDWPVSWSWVWIPIGLGLLAIRMLVMSFDEPEKLHYAEWPPTDSRAWEGEA